MTKEQKVTQLIQELFENKMIGELLYLHILSYAERADNIVFMLYKTCIILFLVTFTATVIINSSIAWVVVVYWIIAALLIYIINRVSFDLILNGICKKPKIDFISEDHIDKDVEYKYRQYEVTPIPIKLLLNVLLKTVPIFEKEPLYVAIKYLGTKAIYKFDGNVLTDEFYNKVINNEPINTDDYAEFNIDEEDYYDDEYEDDDDDDDYIF